MFNVSFKTPTDVVEVTAGTFQWALAQLNRGRAARRRNWRRFLQLDEPGGVYLELWPSGFVRGYQPLAEDMRAIDWEIA